MPIMSTIRFSHLRSCTHAQSSTQTATRPRPHVHTAPRLALPLALALPLNTLTVTPSPPRPHHHAPTTTPPPPRSPCLQAHSTRRGTYAGARAWRVSDSSRPLWRVGHHAAALARRTDGQRHVPSCHVGLRAGRAVLGRYDPPVLNQLHAYLPPIPNQLPHQPFVHRTCARHPP